MSRLIALSLMALVGCGFSPALTPGAPATVLQGAIAVEAPATTDGFALSTRLQDRFGPAGTSRYRLVVDLTRDQSAAAINADGDTTRINLRGTAPWVLRDAAGRAVLSGTAQSFASYAATGSTVATQAAAADAGARLSVALADLIVADIVARAGGLP